MYNQPPQADLEREREREREREIKSKICIMIFEKTLRS